VPRVTRKRDSDRLLRRLERKRSDQTNTPWPCAVKLLGSGIRKKGEKKALIARRMPRFAKREGRASFEAEISSVRGLITDLLTRD